MVRRSKACCLLPLPQPLPLLLHAPAPSSLQGPQRYEADKVRNPRRTICSSHIATLYPLVSFCFCVSLCPVFDWAVLSVFLTGQCVCVCVCDSFFCYHYL